MTLSAGRLGYTYDLGVCWEDVITPRGRLARGPGEDYPVCVAYEGASLAGCWSEGDPAEHGPFGMAGVYAD